MLASTLASSINPPSSSSELPPLPSPAATPSSSSGHRSRKIVIYFAVFASLVFFACFLNIAITDCMNYHTFQQEFDTWNPAWAIVVGRNDETFSGVNEAPDFFPFPTNKSRYCAKMTYETLEGVKVTAASETYCVDNASEIVLGEDIEILYNGLNTDEIVEKDVFGAAKDTLLLEMGFSMWTALVFLGCAFFFYAKRKKPRRRHVVRRDDDPELGQEELERQKQQHEERILAYFQFESVSEKGIPDTFQQTKMALEDCSQTTEADSTEEEETSLGQDSHGDECCICMEKYCKGDHICTSKKNKCNHVFHKACLLEWLQKHDHCPLCRVDLLQDGILT